MVYQHHYRSLLPNAVVYSHRHLWHLNQLLFQWANQWAYHFLKTKRKLVSECAGERVFEICKINGLFYLNWPLSDAKCNKFIPFSLTTLKFAPFLANKSTILSWPEIGKLIIILFLKSIVTDTALNETKKTFSERYITHTYTRRLWVFCVYVCPLSALRILHVCTYITIYFILFLMFHLQVWHHDNVIFSLRMFNITTICSLVLFMSASWCWRHVQMFKNLLICLR